MTTHVTHDRLTKALTENTLSTMKDVTFDFYSLLIITRRAVASGNDQLRDNCDPYLNAVCDFMVRISRGDRAIRIRKNFELFPSEIAPCGIFSRVMIDINSLGAVDVSYCAGQDYRSELATLRDCVDPKTMAKTATRY